MKGYFRFFEKEESGDFNFWVRGLSKIKGVIRESFRKGSDDFRELGRVYAFSFRFISVYDGRRRYVGFSRFFNKCFFIVLWSRWGNMV